MFYVLEIANGDSKIKGKGVYELATLNEAVALFHSKLGIAMKSELYTDELVMVIGADGAVYRSEKYIATPVEPTPVEEVEPTTEESAN